MSNHAQDYSKRNQDAAEKDENKTKHKGIIADSERSCTDILFCLLFLAFCAGMIILAAFAFSKGSPYKLLTPFDSMGFQCGASGPAKW